MRFLLLCCLVATACAGEFSLAAIKDLAAKVTTFRLPFTQTKHLAIQDEPFTNTGAIEVDRGRQSVRWEFTGASVLILTKGKLRRWTMAGVEESLPGGGDPDKSAFAGQMQGFLSGDWTALESAFTLAVDPGGAPLLICSPKSKDIAKFIVKIAIRWRSDLSAPERLEIESAGGDLTTYAFAAPEFGLALPATRFTGP